MYLKCVCYRPALISDPVRLKTIDYYLRIVLKAISSESS